MTAFPRFLDAGDTGLVVEFGDTIDEAINRRVLALDAALASRALEGIRETVPTYRSLLVIFDPLQVKREALAESIRGLLEEAPAKAGPATLWHVPVLYGGVHGEDLVAVADEHGLSPDELIALHASVDYRVYMIGFAPGFAYLGGLPERIHTSRRREPRLVTPPRTVSIGGRQAGISPPVALPSGWNLLGQTPVCSYDPRREGRPFLFAAGDLVRFVPIGEGDYDPLCIAAAAGEIVAQGHEVVRG